MIKQWLKVRKCYKIGHMYGEEGVSCPFTGITYFYCKNCGEKK